MSTLSTGHQRQVNSNLVRPARKQALRILNMGLRRRQTRLIGISLGIGAAAIIMTR